MVFEIWSDCNCSWLSLGEGEHRVLCDEDSLLLDHPEIVSSLVRDEEQVRHERRSLDDD